MMPFLPRTKEEIHTYLLAHSLAKSGLTDTEAGSVIATSLGSVAEDTEAVEYRMKLIRDSFDFTRAVGEDLDERIADMPGMEPRRVEGFASGAVMTLTRGSSAGTLNVPAGSLWALGTDPRIQVRQTAAVTFAAGSLTFPASGDTNYAAVTALTGGYAGNAVPGAINVVVDAPSDVVSCTNTLTLSGGRPRETDDELKTRAVAYLSSLSTCQPAALEFFALNHTDTDGKSVSFAHAFEHPSIPAYTELVVDDGSGLTGLIQAGTLVTGTLPTSAGTAGKIFHANPAVSPITRITNTTTGITWTLDPAAPIWVSKEERGVIDLLDGQTAFSPGDGWSIAAADYQVYTGFLRSLQALIEGDATNPLADPGLRASGTRVKAMPPVTQSLDFVINLILDVGAVFEDVETAVNNAVIAYLASLGPGDPYFESQLISRLHKIEGLTGEDSAVEIPTPGVRQLFPNSPRKSFRLGSIQVT
jgi:uncharacterized phage protein gp47/JayE